jgi:hypothetical protein
MGVNMQPPDNSSRRRRGSHDELVAEILASLEGRSGMDLQLLDILKNTIVTVKPAESAQIDALTRIEQLASKRVDGSENE